MGMGSEWWCEELECSVDVNADILIQESSLHRCMVTCDHDHPQVQLAGYVKATGVPNIYGAQVPVKSKWNLQLLKALLTDYHDQEIVQFLRGMGGWQIGYPPCPHLP